VQSQVEVTCGYEAGPVRTCHRGVAAARWFFAGPNGGPCGSVICGAALGDMAQKGTAWCPTSPAAVIASVLPAPGADHDCHLTSATTARDSSPDWGGVQATWTRTNDCAPDTSDRPWLCAAPLPRHRRQFRLHPWRGRWSRRRGIRPASSLDGNLWCITPSSSEQWTLERQPERESRSRSP